jgi:8-oxo-dGTP pyrophosphatase MutT (NUDIX family)
LSPDQVPSSDRSLSDRMTGFTVLETEEIFDGYRIDVVRDKVQAPDGTVFEREVVKHPGAVAVVAVNDNEQVLLIRQFRTPIRRALLEIPAGTRDVDGEPPEQTALRELHEEAGVKARSIHELGRFWNSPGFCDEETVIYLATDLETVTPERDGPEEREIEVHEIGLDEVEDHLLADGTVDMQTMVGVALAKQFLAGGRHVRE